MKLNYFAILTLGTVFGKPGEHKNAVRLKKDVKSTSNGLVFTVTDLKKHPVVRSELCYSLQTRLLTYGEERK